MNNECGEAVLALGITGVIAYVCLVLCTSLCCMNTNEQKIREENETLRNFIIQSVEHRIMEGLGVKNGYDPDDDESCKED